MAVFSFQAFESYPNTQRYAVMPAPSLKAVVAPNKQRSLIHRRENTQLKPDELEEHDAGFNGLWRSPNGSLYVLDRDRFICVSVHSSRYMVWLNKVAVRDIRRTGNHWIGMQAFRDFNTGTATEWTEITLEFQRDRVIKHFPTYIPREILVHGYIEVYDRVRVRL